MLPFFLSFITLVPVIILALPNSRDATIITSSVNATEPWGNVMPTPTPSTPSTAADCAAPVVPIIANISSTPSNYTSLWPTATAYINGSHSASCYYVLSSAIPSALATAHPASDAPNLIVLAAGPLQTGGCGNSSYIAGSTNIPDVLKIIFTVATGSGATAFASNGSDATSYASPPAVTSISGVVGADGTSTASALVTTTISFCNGPIMTATAIGSSWAWGPSAVPAGAVSEIATTVHTASGGSVSA